MSKILIGVIVIFSILILILVVLPKNKENFDVESNSTEEVSTKTLFPTTDELYMDESSE